MGPVEMFLFLFQKQARRFPMRLGVKRAIAVPALMQKRVGT
jgi:hypothetical protein